MCCKNKCHPTPAPGTTQVYKTSNLVDFFSTLNQLLASPKFKVIRTSINHKLFLGRAYYELEYSTVIPPTGSAIMTFIEGPVGTLPSLEDTMDVKQLVDNQFTTLQCRPLDAARQPATLEDGVVPVWASSDSTILTVEAAADGLSAKVTASAILGVPGAKLGNAQVSCTATLKDGTVATGVRNYNVVGGEVAIFDFDESAPQTFVPPADQGGQSGS